MPDTPTSYTFERFPRKKRVQTAEATEATAVLAASIKARLDSIVRISTERPDTVNEILERQDTIVTNMNALVGQ